MSQEELQQPITWIIEQAVASDAMNGSFWFLFMLGHQLEATSYTLGTVSL